MHSARIAAFATVVLATFNAALVACSSSDAPGTVNEGDEDNRNDGGIRDGAALADAQAGDAAADADASAFECLGDTIDAGDGGAPATCPTSGPCSAACADVRTHYRLGVANAAVACIASLVDCASPAEVVPCVDQAIALACPQASSTDYCKPLLASCAINPDAGTPITQEGCELFANAFSQSGRDVFAACVEDAVAAGACQTEVVNCADAIRQ